MKGFTFEAMVKGSNDLVCLVAVVNGRFFIQTICRYLIDDDNDRHLDIVRARIDKLIRDGQESTVQTFVTQCVNQQLRHFAIERLIDFKKSLSLEELNVFMGALLNLDDDTRSEETQMVMQKVTDAAGEEIASVA